MKINYCLPIIKTNKNEILEIINENINEYQYFEIWLDYIENLNDRFVKTLSEKFKHKIIFLFRRKNLENIQMDFEKRTQIINLLSDSKSYLDLDIIQQKKELDYIKSKKFNLNTIVSYHNYNETPTDNKLGEITDIINEHNPSIIKLSTFCRDKTDSLRLLNILLDLKQKNKKYIVSGMGENGKTVKIYGALWGNIMTFAPLSIEESSAPGQLTKKQLETIFSTLDY